MAILLPDAGAVKAPAHRGNSGSHTPYGYCLSHEAALGAAVAEMHVSWLRICARSVSLSCAAGLRSVCSSRARRRVRRQKCAPRLLPTCLWLQ
jgi:hypothetical protein